MANGKVKWWSDQKGYGFLVPDDGSKEVFVHYSALGGSGFKTLSDGARVEYEVEETPKGLRAKNVKTV